RVIRFVLPLMALAGVGFAFLPGGRRHRGSILALTLSAILGVVLSKGLNPPFSSLGLKLMELPFGGAFRNPVDKFSFLLVPSMCLLFGFGLALMLPRRGAFRAIAVGALLIVC